MSRVFSLKNRVRCLPALVVSAGIGGVEIHVFPDTHQNLALPASVFVEQADINGEAAVAETMYPP